MLQELDEVWLLVFFDVYFPFRLLQILRDVLLDNHHMLEDDPLAQLAFASLVVDLVLDLAGVQNPLDWGQTL